MAIVLGALARYTFVQFNNPIDFLFSDPKRHWDNAIAFFRPSLMNGCDPILYQVYLLFLQTITGKSPVFIGVLTGLLSAAMPWFYYRAGREFGLAKTPGLVFWALMTWMPSFFVIYRYFMIETLLLPLIGLALWMTARALRKRDLASFLILTLCWTLACLTKPQAIPMALICWGYVLLKVNRPQRISATIASLALAVIMLGPNTFRSWTILGYAAPLGSGYIAQIMHAAGTKHTRFHWGKGIWIYSSPSCYIHPFEPLSTWMIERGRSDSTHVVTIDKIRGRTDWVTALQKPGPSTQTSTEKLGENVLLFLFAPSWPDSGTDTVPGALNHWFRWIWAPLLLLVIAGNIRQFLGRIYSLVPILGTASLLLFLLQNNVTMEGRYRKPLEPLILMNAFQLVCIGTRFTRAPDRFLRRSCPFRQK